MDLTQRVLAYMENHRKVMLSSLVSSFNHETPVQMLRSIATLKQEGWIKVNKTFVSEGFSQHRPMVYRTKKTRYTQPTLSPELFN